MKIRNSKDFYAGLIFFSFGVGTVMVAWNYPMGTAARMGPGYFPCVLGGSLAILGLVIGIRALWSSNDKIQPCVLRPLVLVIGSVLAFAGLVQPLGLILATLIMVVTSCLGSGEFHIGEVTVLSIVLVVLAVALFVMGLGIPFNIWPS